MGWWPEREGGDKGSGGGKGTTNRAHRVRHQSMADHLISTRKLNFQKQPYVALRYKVVIREFSRKK